MSDWRRDLQDWRNELRDWRNELRDLLARGESAVLVTVVGTRGSTPREVGATMIVTATETIGTIGGGQLEYQATQQACTWLADADRRMSETRSLQRKFVLGPNCGQCCGGIAEIRFQELTPADSGWAEQLPLQSDRDFHVVIFGAGHVGGACAAILSTLDATIDLVDSRKEFLGGRMPANVTAHELSDAASMVSAAPANSFYLVMTHDHGLDFEICSRILQREDFVYCGLIGSRSKRRRFEKRFRALGFTEAQIASLTCPIGIAEISGKKPAEIAIAVAAQLISLYEREFRATGARQTGSLKIVEPKLAAGGRQ